MSGFVGVCSNSLIASENSVSEALNETVYSKNTLSKNVFKNEQFILGRSFVEFLEVSGMEAYREDVHVWIDGEVYDSNNLLLNKSATLAEEIYKYYTLDLLNNFLSKIDGVFIIVIYDLRKQQLLIATDRYGLKPFYLYQRRQCLIFAPELKCFPYLKPFELKIRSDVVECFMKLQHFMGNTTWFDGVEVTEPSTIYKYSLLTDSFDRRKYWSWASIRKTESSIVTASEEMSDLLDRAIKTRAFGNYRIGVALSGGFDSRAILAAIHKDKPITYTFGIEESQDVRIARFVSKMADVRHTHYKVRVDDWLVKRFSGIWKTDGMLNMYHMHYSHLMDEIPKIMDVNLSGFLGDAVIGGTYLERKGKPFLNTRITNDIAREYYGEYFEFCDPNDNFFDIDKIDPYLFYNRGRRMIGLGAEEADKTIHQRLPFMDTKLLDFSYSLPDEFRLNSRVYHRALLLKYPRFYSQIPHATSGVPIDINPSMFYTSKKMYHRLLWIVKYKLGKATSFTDVHNWIKEPQMSNFIRTLLHPKNALYPNFTKINFLNTFLEPHLAGKGSYAKQVMGAITLEIWLQQIINKNYLDKSK
jgi:asparagine synthase (glutamine-hydrolysing)